MLRDSRKHLRTDLILVVERPDVVRPTLPTKHAVRAPRPAFLRPADPEECRENSSCGARWPIGSCRSERDALERQGFPILKPVCKDSKCQRLRLCLSVLCRLCVHEHTGQLSDFRDPTPIVFPVDFNLEIHTRRIPQPAAQAERPSVSRACLSNASARHRCSARVRAKSIILAVYIRDTPETPLRPSFPFCSLHGIVRPLASHRSRIQTGSMPSWIGNNPSIRDIWREAIVPPRRPGRYTGLWP